ncbi:MAG: internal scaffolding protein [Microvirus sp.]|nr:MAG: internal scaffolding protein [Microvirus sp.]
MILKQAYDDFMPASDETALVCLDKSLTQQSGRDEADINVIVERYVRTGVVPQIAMPPLGEDFDEVFDFRSAMDTVLEAKRSFDALPANVRYKFKNDPAEFVDFCEDRDNLPMLRKWGLAVPEVGADVGVSGGVNSPVGGEVGAAARGGQGDGIAAGGSQGGSGSVQGSKAAVGTVVT